MRPNSANTPSSILLEADEIIIVKPFEVGRLTDLVREKMLTRRPTIRVFVPLKLSVVRSRRTASEVWRFCSAVGTVYVLL